MEIGKRIKSVRNELKYDINDFASIFDMSSGNLSKIERNYLRPSAEMLAEIVRRWGVNAEWLLTGEGEMFAGESKADTIAQLRSVIKEKESGKHQHGGLVEIPYYDAVRVSAGYGIEVFTEEPDGVYEMPPTFFGMNTANIKCLRVAGDSMRPRFDDGDYVFINPLSQLRTEGIYVIRVKGSLLVKKVQWLPDGIKLISENKEYEPVLLNEDTCPPDEVAIIGKVVLIVARP